MMVITAIVTISQHKVVLAMYAQSSLQLYSVADMAGIHALLESGRPLSPHLFHQ